MESAMLINTKNKKLIIMALPEESDNLIENVLSLRENNFILVYTGIGLISAAQKTTEAIIKHQPDWVLNLGTAGSRKFSQRDLIECTEFIYRGQMSSMLKNNYKVQAFSNLPTAVCASADHIDEGEISVVCDAMDMEAFAIANVCEAYNVKFNSIKYITDSSDEKMWKDWKAHLKLAAVALSDFLKNHIHR